MNPFIYPKSRYIRRLTPRNYTAYTSYKPFLRDEFERKCVYCRMPDTMRGQDNFGTDHYRPKKRFPHLATTYSNLFYCCNACNSRKGNYWPAAQDASSRFVPNPCDHEMFSHLRFKLATVEVRTAAGTFTQELLDLNDPETVNYREFVLEAIDLCEAKKQEVLVTASNIRGQLSAGAISHAAAEGALALLDGKLASLDAHLLRLTGGQSSV